MAKNGQVIRTLYQKQEFQHFEKTAVKGKGYEMCMYREVAVAKEQRKLKRAAEKGAEEARDGRGGHL